MTAPGDTSGDMNGETKGDMNGETNGETNGHVRDGMRGLEALQQAIATGEMDRVRERLLALDDDERAVLEARLGADVVRRIYQRVRRARRGPVLGRVVVLHGIMGSQLDSVDARGDADRIWVNYFRLAAGRMAELRLTPDGQPAQPRHRIRLGGLFPEYLPLLTELAERWEVLPVAYDWRHDLDRSADALAAAIAPWAQGRPVHIVAHSMGGLVARRFIQRHPDAWRAMADPNGLASGGRLVMLGTPNRGSLAIPLVLTGREKTVKMLELLDVRHGMAGLLRVIGSFAGVYQMLPSAELPVGDDRAALFDAASWGELPVHASLLARARAVHAELERAVDTERMLYVAGYDQRTPHRVRVDAPGRFSYQQTLDGDGRVPHELGLLDGVRTWWVREGHGDLPRNRRVLEGIHDLLERGATTALEQHRPVRRGVEEEMARWQTGDEIEPIPAEVASAALRPVRRGTTSEDDTIDAGASDAGAFDAGAFDAGASDAGAFDGAGEDDVEARARAARVEGWLVRDWLGTPGAPPVPAVEERPAETRRAPGRRGTRAVPTLAVEVWWGDITQVKGDVHVVGHYENVLPQFAELALDYMVSGRDAKPAELVLTNLARRGILQGKLGSVELFPWASGERGGRTGRLVAVAGMGHPGTFREPELRRLARNVTWTVSSLPDARTVCMVLIGGGAGNLGVEAALRGLVRGTVDGLDAVGRRSIERVRIVELELGKATRIHRALRELAASPGVASEIDLRLDDDVIHGAGGRMGSEHCLALTLAAAASAAGGRPRSREARALERLLGAVREPAGFGERALEALAELARANGARDDGTSVSGVQPRLSELAARLSVEIGDGAPPDGGRPARISFVRDANAIVVAALTDSAVVPERRSAADPSLLEEAIAEMVDPDPEAMPRLATSLHRFLVPEDFRPILEREHAVTFEVDRDMAAVPWEMLASHVDETEGEAPVPLSLRAPVARQLRTTYSPPPGVARASRWPLRALVIGDPGDPDAGESLPGARREALEVARILRARGLEVTLLVGAPGGDRDDLPRDVAPARRWDVLEALMGGDYDLLHYAGHGDFDEHDPSRTGWVFKGGLLTSRELERVGLSPALVVANACLSARASRAGGGRRAKDAPIELHLLPGLADEFFRRGVRNYVGTAWEVSDLGAVEFARVFYDTLLPTPGTRPVEEPTVGLALLAARRALHAQEAKFGALWAAYQHYGDPNHRVAVELPETDADGARGAAVEGDARGADGRTRSEEGDGTEDGEGGGKTDGTKNSIPNIRGGRAKPARETAARKAAKRATTQKSARKSTARKRAR